MPGTEGAKGRWRRRRALLGGAGGRAAPCPCRASGAGGPPPLALGGPTDLGRQVLRHDVEGQGDRPRVLLREVTCHAAPRADALHPVVNNAQVFLFELAHGNHDHVEIVHDSFRIEHPGDQFAVGVIALASEVVAVREANQPLLGVCRCQARLAKQLQTLGHGVEKARAA